jgi:predicted acylesterase/phospholipase RssA
MISDWKSNEFKIAINMAGAVSAGAYTAGVLDFLIEALEEWEKAKVVARTAFLNGAQAVSSDQLAPLHNVSIEAFSGASAGGMCAAIASVMVQRPFQHVTSKEVKNTNNTFYEAWVNQIDISELLGTKDLANRQPLVSLLDSTAIDQIAQSALTPTTFTRSAYISEALTLFLTLTNVRGVPYRLYADPSPGLDEFTTYYADRIRFEIVQPGRSVSCSLAKPLPLSEPQGFAWNLLKEAAKATGAFPLFLAPRVLKRDLSDYAVPPWIPISEAEPIPPIISDLPEPPPSGIETLNVDGGVTDNDPFDLAHDFLASHNPEATSDAPPTNPRSPLKANCAVISVAPFPSADRYDRKYDVSVAQGILRMAGRLVTVLISQSRFFGESLALITGKASLSLHPTVGLPQQARCNAAV